MCFSFYQHLFLPFEPCKRAFVVTIFSVSNADQAQVISDRAVKIMNTSSIVAPVIMSVFGFAAIIYHALSLNVLRNEDSRATHSKVSAVLGITYATSLVIFVAILSVCVIYNMLQMTREMEGKNDDQSDQIRASNTKVCNQ